MKVLSLAAVASAISLHTKYADFSGSSVYDLSGRYNEVRSFIIEGQVPEGTTALNAD